MPVRKISDVSEMLVPLDGRDASLRSVPVAGRIADRLELSLRLMTVADDPDAATARLGSLAERLLPGRDVAIDAASGDPAEAIVQAAGTDKLVCMATGATLLPHGGHVGSVAEEVVREVGRPVILLGPRADLDPGKPTERIVVPVDGSAMSELAIDVAGDLAKALGAEAWLVSVIPPKLEVAAEHQIGRNIGAAEVGYVRRLARELGHQFGIETGYEVLHIKDTAEAILDFTSHDGAVVMTTHGRSGLSRLFAGSVARGVVARSSRPVIVYRPSPSE